MLLFPMCLQRVIATTMTYQRSINVEDCEELTKEVFPHLSSCEYIRSLNLSGTAVEDLSFAPVRVHSG
jgi:ribosome maturation factor RimP